MSSYVVEDQTINRILTAVDDMPGALAALELPADPDGLILLGQRMFEMNVAAVCQRYADENPANYADGHQYQYELATPVEAYKALHCYLYQCTEGDVPEQPLYRFLRDTVERRLAVSIISELPAYRAADWG